jgi:hypothetical protein
MRDFLGRGGGAAYPETVSLYAPNPSPFSGSPAGLAAMDERARDIFRRIVETYLETGDPVGSRTLSQTGIALSPASIRNTMQDLAMAGLLGAPHTSAGRIPTHAGLRLFVDGLLEIGDLGTEERREIELGLGVGVLIVGFQSRLGDLLGDRGIGFLEPAGTTALLLHAFERALDGAAEHFDPTGEEGVSIYGLGRAKKFLRPQDF